MSLIDDGVDIIREENSYEPIAELINDSVVKIRENGYNVLLNTANNHYGCLYLIENELVPILVDKSCYNQTISFRYFDLVLPQDAYKIYSICKTDLISDLKD